MSSSSPLIGLYGGSFDPVHQGHIATVLELQARLPFTQIRLLPAARSPLKAGSLSSAHRLAMLQLAIEGKRGLTIDARELQRPPPSYTITTLCDVRAELGPAAALVFILGQDSFAQLPQWQDWQQLTRYAHLLVVSRPGAETTLPVALADWLQNRRISTPKSLESPTLPDGQGGVLFMQTAPYAVASREIRAALARRQDTQDWLAPAVRDYIERHQLYRGDQDPQ